MATHISEDMDRLTDCVGQCTICVTLQKLKMGTSLESLQNLIFLTLNVAYSITFLQLLFHKLVQKSIEMRYMLILILLLKSQHTLHTYSGEGNPKILSYNIFLYNLSEPGACYGVRYENAENLNDSLYALSLTTFI